MMGGMLLPMNHITSRGTRRWMLASICLTLTTFAMPMVWGQNDKGEEDIKPRAETLLTKDNFRIAITYYPSALKQDASVVVLLQGLSGNQLDWGGLQGLPKQLQTEGMAVIAVDLRGHGQSKGANDDIDPAKPAKGKAKASKTGKATVDASSLTARDYQSMVGLDMEAVKQFIFTEHQKKKLNMNRMAIIGSGLGAAVALKYAAVDWLKTPHSDGPVGNQTPRGQDVRALVLLTPDAEIAGLPLPDAIKTLRAPALQVAMMFAVGKKDKLDKGQTKKLFDQAESLEKVVREKKPDFLQKMYLVEYPTPAHGSAMLGKGLNLEVNIANFLKKHLQELQSEWRDRESRVGKKKAV